MIEALAGSGLTTPDVEYSVDVQRVLSDVQANRKTRIDIVIGHSKRRSASNQVDSTCCLPLATQIVSSQR